MADNAHRRPARRDRHKRTIPGLLVGPLFLWACGQTPPPAPATIDFETVRYTALGGGPSALLDVNHDGKPDIIDGGAYLLGRGDGTFTPLVGPRDPSLVYDFTRESGASFVDVDGDGLVDAVTTSLVDGASTTTVARFYRGRGDGSYEQPVASPIGDAAGLIESSDLDGDGRAEIIYELAGPENTLFVYRADTSGVLRVSTTIAASGLIGASKFVDINGDGRVDLLAVRQERISVYLQDVDGGFQPPVDTAVASPIGLLTGDVDGDGKLDVLVPSQSSRSLTVLLGQRRGAFLPGGSVDLGGQPGFLTLVDLDGDGRLDLINNNDAGVRLQRGNGDGSFVAARVLDLPPWTTRPSFIDLNGDGRPDLLFGESPDRRYSSADGFAVALNQGGGRFRVAPFINPGFPHSASAVGSFSPDGKPALVLALDRDIGRLGAGFSDAGPIAVDQTLLAVPSALSVADLDGDGRDDVVTLDSDPSAKDRSVGVSVLYAGADGALGKPLKLTVGSDPYALAAGDLNGDGLADIVVCNRNDARVSVLLAQGRGNLLSARAFASTLVDGTGALPQGVALGDVNRDGAPDLVVYQPSRGALSVYLGDGSGDFRVHATLAVGSPALQQRIAAPIKLADLNHDGKLDLVFAPAPAMALGVGDGTFGALQALPVRGGSAVRTVEIADLDRDGHPDLIFLTSAAQVLRGSGDGRFQAPLDFSDGGLAPRNLLLADGDGDGKPDLFLVNEFATSFLRNITP